MLSGLPLFLQPFRLLQPEEFEEYYRLLSGQAILVLWAEDLHLQVSMMELVGAQELELEELQVFRQVFHLWAWVVLAVLL